MGRELSCGRGRVGFCTCIPQYLSLYFTLPADWGPQIQCSPDRLSSLNPVFPRYVYKWHDGVQAGWDCNARNGPKVLNSSIRFHNLLSRCSFSLVFGALWGPSSRTQYRAQLHTHSRWPVNKLEPQPVAWDRVKIRRVLMCFNSMRVTRLIGTRVQDMFLKLGLGTKLVVYYSLHFSVLTFLAGRLVFQISVFIHYPSHQSRTVLSTVVQLPASMEMFCLSSPNW